MLNLADGVYELPPDGIGDGKRQSIYNGERGVFWVTVIGKKVVALNWNYRSPGFEEALKRWPWMLTDRNLDNDFKTSLEKVWGISVEELLKPEGAWAEEFELE